MVLASNEAACIRCGAPANESAPFAGTGAGTSATSMPPILHFRRPRSVIRAGEAWFLEFRLAGAEAWSRVRVNAWVECEGRRVARVTTLDQRMLLGAAGAPMQFPQVGPGHHVIRVEVERDQEDRRELWTGWFGIAVELPSDGDTNIFVSGDNNTVTGGDSFDGTGNLKYGDQRAPRGTETHADWQSCELSAASPRARVVRMASPVESTGIPHALTIRRASGTSVSKRILFGTSIVIGRENVSHVDLRLILPPGQGGKLHAALASVSNRALVIDASSLPDSLRIRIDNRLGARVSGSQLNQGSVHELTGIHWNSITTIDLGAPARVRVEIRALPRKTSLRNLDRGDLGREAETELLGRKSRVGGFSVVVTVDGQRCEYVWALGSLPAEYAGFADAGRSVVIVVAGECPWAVECPTESGATPFAGEARAWPLLPGACIDLGCGSPFRVNHGIEVE